MGRQANGRQQQDEPAEDPRQWATENTEYPAPKPAEETSPEDLTLNSQDCKVSPDSKDEPEGDEMSTETTTQTETPATEAAAVDTPAAPAQAVTGPTSDNDDDGVCDGYTAGISAMPFALTFRIPGVPLGGGPKAAGSAT